MDNRNRREASQGLVVIFNRVVREGLSTKGTLKQKPESMEGASHGDVWEEEFSRQRQQSVQRSSGGRMPDVFKALRGGWCG